MALKGFDDCNYNLPKISLSEIYITVFMQKIKAITLGNSL